ANRTALEQFVRLSLEQRISATISNPEFGGLGVAEKLSEAGLLPMFGMPSRGRNLFHISKGRILTIDRDLDPAITEFAPGSQKTKDKAVYTSIGFTAPLREIGNRIENVAQSPVPEIRWMARCSRCHTTVTATEEPGGNQCENCGADESLGFRKFQFVV